LLPSAPTDRVHALTPSLASPPGFSCTPPPHTADADDDETFRDEKASVMAAILALPKPGENAAPAPPPPPQQQLAPALSTVAENAEAEASDAGISPRLASLDLGEPA